MQYKKLGFCWLTGVFDPKQVQFTVTGNRSEDPQLFILPHVTAHSTTRKTPLKSQANDFR
jgi:hypothetical protein